MDPGSVIATMSSIYVPVADGYRMAADVQRLLAGGEFNELLLELADVDLRAATLAQRDAADSSDATVELQAALPLLYAAYEKATEAGEKRVLWLWPVSAATRARAFSQACGASLAAAATCDALGNRRGLERWVGRARSSFESWFEAATPEAPVRQGQEAAAIGDNLVHESTRMDLAERDWERQYEAWERAMELYRQRRRAFDDLCEAMLRPS